MASQTVALLGTVTAAAAHVQSVDGVWPNFQDIEGLRKFALQSRRLGFSGMSLIHPSQIDEVNSAFTPTAEEVDYCRRVVQAFDDARARGEGAIDQVEELAAEDSAQCFDGEQEIMTGWDPAAPVQGQGAGGDEAHGSDVLGQGRGVGDPE